MIVSEHGCPHRKRLEAWYERRGAWPERTIELGSYHAMLGCVIAGMGAALLPRSVLAIIAGPSRSVSGSSKIQGATALPIRPPEAVIATIRLTGHWRIWLSTATLDLEEAAHSMIGRACYNSDQLGLPRTVRMSEFEDWFYEHVVGVADLPAEVWHGA
jgi:DNA-binding transcriptional LysR family regulator